MKFVRKQIRNGHFLADIQSNLALFSFGLDIRPEDMAGSGGGDRLKYDKIMYSSVFYRILPHFNIWKFMKICKRTNVYHEYDDITIHGVSYDVMNSFCLLDKRSGFLVIAPTTEMHLKRNYTLTNIT